MLHRLPLALAVAAIFAGTAWAETPLASRTDLVSVYQHAVDNNADLAAARAQFRARQEVVP
ncbi:Channel protein TolC OS=Stutzerimonas stutzeri OX=316 GN=CXK95_14255 PE=3 SV=1 [Stutzerimonas stutzeri]